MRSRILRRFRRRVAPFLVGTGAAAAALSGAGPTRAANCQPATGQSTCFDADALWAAPAPSRFVAIPAARAAPPGAFSLGLDATYLSRPVVLHTLSPDPAGRDVLAVDDVVDASLSASYVPTRRLELSLVVPAALARTGTSETAATSQNGSALSAQAFRDVRFGAAHDLYVRDGAALHVDSSARLDLALPTGDENAFAGERGLLLAPGLALGVRMGRFFSGAMLGARLRRPVEIGGTRLGTQIVSMLGAGVSILPHLDAALEAWMLPTPLSQERTFRDGVRVTDGLAAPSEWLLSVRSTWNGFQVQGGIGTAIPLSSETRLSPSGAEAVDHFAAITSPRFRGVLVLRYSPAISP